MKFNKDETKLVSWVAAFRVECPYCHASARTYCTTTHKDGTRSAVAAHHKARKNAYLLSKMFVIPEALVLADAL